MPSSIVLATSDVGKKTFLAILRVMSRLSLSRDSSNVDFSHVRCLDPGNIISILDAVVIRGMAFAASQSTSVYPVSKKANLWGSRTLVPDRGSSQGCAVRRFSIQPQLQKPLRRF